MHAHARLLPTTDLARLHHKPLLLQPNEQSDILNSDISVAIVTWVAFGQPAFGQPTLPVNSSVL